MEAVSSSIASILYIQDIIGKKTFYEDTFEKPIIEAINKHIKSEGESWFDCSNPPGSIKKVLTQLKIIENDITKCIPLEDSCTKIIQECRRKFFQYHAFNIILFSMQVLDKENWNDVHNLFKIIKLFESSETSWAKHHMRIQFQRHVKEKCYKKTSLIEKKNDEHYKFTFIQYFAALYQEYSDVVDNVFEGNEQFKESLNEVCTKIVNKQADTISAQACVQYIDNLLTKSNSNMSAEDAKKHLNEVINIVKFIKDQKTFMKLYLKALAKRLIFSKFTFDQEENLIEKLSNGWEYITKLKKMINDISGTVLFTFILLLPVTNFQIFSYQQLAGISTESFNLKLCLAISNPTLIF